MNTKHNHTSKAVLFRYVRRFFSSHIVETAQLFETVQLASTFPQIDGLPSERKQVILYCLGASFQWHIDRKTLQSELNSLFN